MQRFSRRQFFRLSGASGAVAFAYVALDDLARDLPAGADPPPPFGGGFVPYIDGSNELLTLGAAVDQLVPGIGAPSQSASQLGVVDYINVLLSGFNGVRPDGSSFIGLDDKSGCIYPSGPYRVASGASAGFLPGVPGFPQYVEEGGPGFYTFQPLSTVKAIGWRKQVDNWRYLYMQGIEYLDTRAAALFPPAKSGPGAFYRAGTYPVNLPGEPTQYPGQAAQLEILENLDYAGDPFFAALYDHTMEGAYAHPVYAGNGGSGNLGYFAWETFGFGGDVNGIRLTQVQSTGVAPTPQGTPTPADQPWLPTTSYTHYDDAGNTYIQTVSPQGAWAIFGGYAPLEMIAPGYNKKSGGQYPTEDPTTSPTPSQTKW